jgi:hypothetical protein
MFDLQLWNQVVNRTAASLASLALELMLVTKSSATGSRGERRESLAVLCRLSQFQWKP